MALTDFLRVNLPYGMRKDKTGKWFTFNREYNILGFNEVDYVSKFSIDLPFDKLPVYTEFKGLTDMKLLTLVNENCRVQYDKNGSIELVFFYNDGSTPNSGIKEWEKYQKLLFKLSKFETK